MDGVIVCTATADHREIVTRCLTAGKHVFVEKVLADRLTDAEAIAAAARASGLALTVSMRRSDDDYTAKITSLIGDGAVRQITSARVRDGHPFALPRPGHPDGTLPAQFWDRNQAQGGVLIDLCHPVYLLAALMGRPDRVSAVLGHVTGRDLEDNATVVLSFPDGAVGIAETSSVSAITPFMIEIHGTGGSILLAVHLTAVVEAAYASDSAGRVVDLRTPEQP